MVASPHLVEQFFKSKGTTATRAECDEFARTICGGGRAIPVMVQGTSSYTVTAGPGNSRLVQFRSKERCEITDIDVITVAKSVHADLVVEWKLQQKIGKRLKPLWIYGLSEMRGRPYILTRTLSPVLPLKAILPQARTVLDLAKFFADSWMKGPKLYKDIDKGLFDELSGKIDRMASSLPLRFTDNLQRIKALLPSIFYGLPVVLNHNNLCELNILVDPANGGIQGIIDWAQARIMPWGISLWGLDLMLGYMDEQGWHYYDNHRELEALFWQTLLMSIVKIGDRELKLIRASRMLGLFCRYGLAIVDGQPATGVLDPSTESMYRYLDAFCASDDWAPILAPNGTVHWQPFACVLNSGDES